jgi:hypothetical protein
MDARRPAAPPVGNRADELARLRAENAGCRWDFISDHAPGSSVLRLCRVLGTARSGYHKAAGARTSSSKAMAADPSLMVTAAAA